MSNSKASNASCPVCGKKFVKKSTNHKFCSEKCKRTAARKAEAKKAKNPVAKKIAHKAQKKPVAKPVALAEKIALPATKAVQKAPKSVYVDRGDRVFFNKNIPAVVMMSFALRTLSQAIGEIVKD